MGSVVIIDELGHCLVMASSEHSRWCLFGGKLLDISRLVGSVGGIAANHLLVLPNSDTFALHQLEVFES